MRGGGDAVSVYHSHLDGDILVGDIKNTRQACVRTSAKVFEYYEFSNIMHFKFFDHASLEISEAT